MKSILLNIAVDERLFQPQCIDIGLISRRKHTLHCGIHWTCLRNEYPQHMFTSVNEKKKKSFMFQLELSACGSRKTSPLSSLYICFWIFDYFKTRIPLESGLGDGCIPANYCAAYITKTCLYNFDPLKPHFHIVKLGFTGYTLFFLFLLKHIDCGYSLEPPRWGGSNEFHQSVFWAEIWILSENFQFLEVNFSIYMNTCRRVFVMIRRFNKTVSDSLSSVCSVFPKATF